MKTPPTYKAAGRPRRNPKAAASSIVSVRFTADERRSIEEAAALRKIPAASFIREAAWDRAEDYLNANGAEEELREMAALLASQLNPKTLDKGVLVDMLTTATIPFVKILEKILWEHMDKERGYTSLSDRRTDTPTSKSSIGKTRIGPGRKGEGEK